MKIFIYVMLIIMISYTVGVAKSLWKDNKIGAIAIFFLAIAIVVMPFFSILK
ncbi:hypothetical protein [Fredinandcohnia sp. 179-A 10B2 NHS]|uniref:hypothetical protein n=1 Tax=Fredinandcohnia sp. 179-A 10B2 NHS TaxID=3235176 RepID=UPI00399F9048